MHPRKLILLIAVCGASCVFAPAASAQEIGGFQGVTVSDSPRGKVLHFSRKAAPIYRRIAGRRVAVGCGRLKLSRGAYVTDSEGGTVIRTPRRRGPILTFNRGQSDYCFVRRPGPHGETIAIAPRTEAGATYLDELTTVGLILFAAFAGGDDDGAEPPGSIEQMVAASGGLVVALDGPHGTPPAGRVGYWTDGMRFVLVAVSARGRRLFLDQEGDVVRTNILSQLLELG